MMQNHIPTAARLRYGLRWRFNWTDFVKVSKRGLQVFCVLMVIVGVVGFMQERDLADKEAQCQEAKR